MTMGGLPPRLIRLTLGAYEEDLRILLKRAYDEGAAFAYADTGIRMNPPGKSFDDWYKWVMED